jgi:hypothetical protein
MTNKMSTRECSVVNLLLLLISFLNVYSNLYIKSLHLNEIFFGSNKFRIKFYTFFLCRNQKKNFFECLKFFGSKIFNKFF